MHISGSVSGKYEGENALGSKITAPAIVADSVEVVTYQEACAPTLYTVTVQTAAQTQCGYTVSVDSVELAEKETRVAVTVTNNGQGSLFVRQINSSAPLEVVKEKVMSGMSMHVRYYNDKGTPLNIEQLQQGGRHYNRNYNQKHGPDRYLSGTGFKLSGTFRLRDHQ